jgi:hypothetical protein
VTDLLCVDRLVPIGERRVAQDHEHVGDPRQIGREVLGNPVGKILLVGVAAMPETRDSNGVEAVLTPNRWQPRRAQRMVAKTSMKSVLYGPIPYASEQGIFCGIAGNLNRRSGKFPP